MVNLLGNGELEKLQRKATKLVLGLQNLPFGGKAEEMAQGDC